VPRRDVYHTTVVTALLADGWTITDDPLLLAYGSTDVYVDLGAERPLGAQKGNLKIAAEIKSFVGASDVHELEIALGQYALYRDILSEVEPDRILYLAIAERVFDGIFSTQLGQLIRRREQLRLLVFDESTARVVQWIP
jgi:hypothetical protein